MIRSDEFSGIFDLYEHERVPIQEPEWASKDLAESQVN